MTEAKSISPFRITTTRLKPREKLRLYGVTNLTNTELVALIIGSGSKKYSVFALARKLTPLLESHQFKTKTAKTLPLGKNQYARLLAVAELTNRLAHPGLTTITKPKDIWYLCQHLAKKKQEYVEALYLDGQQRLLSQATLAIGGQNFALLEPNVLLHGALKLPASSCVLIHNHPSGDHQPSQDDILVSQRLSQACDLVGVHLLDHIIISHSGWSSLKELGLL